jgi:hypothetical protein
MQRIKDFLKNFLGFSIVLIAIFMWGARFFGENSTKLKGQGERSEMNDKKLCIMTVFIHGTIVRYFSPTALFRALKGVKKDNSYKSNYRNFASDYNEAMRLKSYYGLQAINRKGLISVKPAEGVVEKEEFFASRVTARLYSDISQMAKVDDKVANFDVSNKFYTFGWSGDLSDNKRKQAAFDLYDELLNEAERLKKEENTEIEIHIVAHSHGGNVGLLLAEEEISKQKNLVIDKLIMWGTPVQSETEKLVDSSIFKKVYHFYSLGDHVQVADFVSTQDLFSRRTIGEVKKDPVSSDRLAQIEIQVGGYKPYHVELWLFGLSKFPYLFYRKNFPLHPLPVMLFTPAFVSMIDAAQVKGHLFLPISNDGDKYSLKLFSREEKLKKERSPLFSPLEIDISLLKKRAFDWING